MFEFQKSSGFKINLTQEQAMQLSDKSTIENALTDESVIAFDILLNGEIIGFSMLKNCETGFFLWDYAIDSRHQSKGYGKSALQELIEILQIKYDASWITTTYKYGNERAKRLYDKLGFVETDIVKLENVHEANMLLKLK